MSNMFSGPPKPPAPTLMEDTDQIAAARRKSIADQRKRSGVQSTILSDPTKSETLGGG
jgi:hypothetical protein